MHVVKLLTIIDRLYRFWRTSHAFTIAFSLFHFFSHFKEHNSLHIIWNYKKIQRDFENMHTQPLVMFPNHIRTFLIYSTLANSIIAKEF